MERRSFFKKLIGGIVATDLITQKKAEHEVKEKEKPIRAHRIVDKPKPELHDFVVATGTDIHPIIMSGVSYNHKFIRIKNKDGEECYLYN